MKELEKNSLKRTEVDENIRTLEIQNYLYVKLL